MIGIRVDANQKIGSGHIMRCLTIAREIRKLGNEVLFFVADQESEKVLNEAGYLAYVLSSSWNSLDHEVEVLLEALYKTNITVLLLDSYYITAEALGILNEKIIVIYIDDYGEKLLPVSMLIHYGFVEQRIMEERYNKTTTQLLIGPSFIPIREEFRYHTSKIYSLSNRILVTTGGTDVDHSMLRLLKECIRRELQRTQEFYFIIGRYNKDREQIMQQASFYQSIHCEYQVTDMSKWMAKCDLAITAGGCTLYELCAMGCPAICYTIAKNQIPGTKQLEQKGLLYYVGDLLENEENIIEKIINQLEWCVQHVDECGQMACKMRQAVDGLGASRIALEIKKRYIERI